MNLHETIKHDYFHAMKTGDKKTKAVLSMVIPRIDAIAKEQTISVVPDAEVLRAIQAEGKQVKQSIEGAQNANRPEQVEKYQADLAVLESYLPKQVTDRELEAVVSSVLIDMGDSNFGDILREVSSRVSGGADNKRISQVIKKLK